MTNYEWRKAAKTELVRNVKYCVREFGKRVARKFVEAIDHQVQLLIRNPRLGTIEPLLADRRRKYHSLVVHSNFKLIYYYDEKKDTIHIVDLWDTRREPEKLARRVSSK